MSETRKITLQFPSLRAFLAEYAERISSEGMLLRSEAPPAAGSSVAVEVVVAEGMRLLRARGETLWSGTSGIAGGHQVAAIRFDQLDESSRTLIERIVEQRRRDGGEPFALADVPGPREARLRDLTVPAAAAAQPASPATGVEPESVFDLTEPLAAAPDLLATADAEAPPARPESAAGPPRRAPVAPVPLLADPQPAPFDLEPVAAPAPFDLEPVAAPAPLQLDPADLDLPPVPGTGAAVDEGAEARPAESPAEPEGEAAAAEATDLSDLFGGDEPEMPPAGGRTEAFPPSFVDEVEAELAAADGADGADSSYLEVDTGVLELPTGVQDEATPVVVEAAMKPADDVEPPPAPEVEVDLAAPPPAAIEPSPRPAVEDQPAPRFGAEVVPSAEVEHERPAGPAPPLDAPDSTEMSEPEPVAGLVIPAPIEAATEPPPAAEPAAAESPPMAEPAAAEPPPVTEPTAAESPATASAPPPPPTPAPDAGRGPETVEIPIFAAPPTVSSEPVPESVPMAEPPAVTAPPPLAPPPPSRPPTVAAPPVAAGAPPAPPKRAPVVPSLPALEDDNLLSIPELGMEQESRAPAAPAGAIPPTGAAAGEGELPSSAQALRGAASRSRHFGTWLLIALLAGAVVVAGFFMLRLVRGAGSPPPAERAAAPRPAREAPASDVAKPSAAESVVAEPAAADAGVGGPLAGGEATTEDGTEVPGAQAVGAEAAPGAAGAAAEPPAAEPAPAAPATPLTGLNRITWTETDGGTVLALVADGEISRQAVELVPIGGEQPRLIIKISGVERAFQPAVLEVGTAEVRRVRTGLHPGSQLHVVIDLAGPGILVRDLVPRGERLEVRLAAE